MDFAYTLDLLRGFFEGQGQPFGVIGTLGIAARGSGRAATEVEIVAPAGVRPELIPILEGSGFTAEHRTATYVRLVHDNPDLGRLNIVFLGAATAEKILAGVEMLPGPKGRDIPVPLPEHLAALKVIAIKNSPKRASQDLKDIKHLLDIPGVDQEKIRGFFTKSGLGDLLEELG